MAKVTYSEVVPFIGWPLDGNFDLGGRANIEALRDALNDAIGMADLAQAKAAKLGFDGPGEMALHVGDDGASVTVVVEQEAATYGAGPRTVFAAALGSLEEFASAEDWRGDVAQAVIDMGADRDAFTPNHIAAVADVSEYKAEVQLEALVDAGVLEQAAFNRYRIAGA